MANDESAPPAEQPEIHVLKKFTMDLEVKLAHDEHRVRGVELAAAMGDHGGTLARHEHQKRQMKAEVAEGESRIERLRNIVATASELRTTDVEDRADYKSGRMERVRLDSGKVIHGRSLTEEERQIRIPGA